MHSLFIRPTVSLCIARMNVTCCYSAREVLPSHSPVRKDEDKAIYVTGRGGPYGCETSRLPHCLDIRLTDGGEPYEPTAVYPKKIPCTNFC
jgi:hypothetical protein